MTSNQKVAIVTAAMTLESGRNMSDGKLQNMMKKKINL
jgi:hypothetical protein